MLLKPKRITGVGIIQTFLAASFVIWLLFFPSTGPRFAWPITPEFSAMFIGTAFMIRTYLGIQLWRQKYWHRLRWSIWGNYGFLTVILVGTFWHVEQMNWFTNIWVAHIWVIAYVLEPLTLPVFEPRGPEANAPFPKDELEGPISEGFKWLLLLTFNVGVGLGLLLFINPEFMTTRWPWPLDPFDSRIMAAFPIMGGLWGLKAYTVSDWAEAKPGVIGILILLIGLFVVWAFNLPRYDFGRENVIEYGVITGTMAILYGYFFWRQERAKKDFISAGA